MGIERGHAGGINITAFDHLQRIVEKQIARTLHEQNRKHFVRAIYRYGLNAPMRCRGGVSLRQQSVVSDQWSVFRTCHAISASRRRRKLALQTFS